MDTPALVQSFSNLGVHHGHEKTPESSGCWALPSRKGGVQEFVFPRSFQVMLILCWGTHFERTIVIGRSSSICKSRELKTWCIQKTLSSCLRSSGEDSSLPLPKTGVLSLVKELRIFMPYGAAKKTSKNNLNKFQCEDMVRDKAGEEK